MYVHMYVCMYLYPAVSLEVVQVEGVDTYICIYIYTFTPDFYTPGHNKLIRISVNAWLRCNTTQIVLLGWLARFTIKLAQFLFCRNW